MWRFALKDVLWNDVVWLLKWSQLRREWQPCHCITGVAIADMIRRYSVQQTSALFPFCSRFKHSSSLLSLFLFFLVCSVFFILSLLLPLGIKKKKKQLKINLKNYPHPVPLLPLTTPSQLPLPLLSTYIPKQPWVQRWNGNGKWKKDKKVFPI